MDFQCTHTMGGPAPSLHRESTDSLIVAESKKLGMEMMLVILLEASSETKSVSEDEVSISSI